ncbi:uncharacterized protein TRAVEDRAFT_26197 [Trametes versicolor FP-101664 SS1]|uniref:uncharacterized protein n=1 Tax=Trametes versicolor (strain FP-101664) TaxID=717944 RepID=UPI0004621F79|nr:uncharacterized protein TRAVEDRAFT_26197 [Trametes versicolor FP-101664 SS1]EIW62437.1 hypothetical protein TRAVEDRAFT_26197 [Trametes versicolor FP-101664 SS1]
MYGPEIACIDPAIAYPTQIEAECRSLTARTGPAALWTRIWPVRQATVAPSQGRATRHYCLQPERPAVETLAGPYVGFGRYRLTGVRRSSVNAPADESQYDRAV